ncbi:hypothetical protein QOZ80_4AG0307750 [Eleusine coracana subsp. coracana]|nr:hypothetical protein QOZ80_4AG0307750 [Eleusine coracana subsp. coracana]
MQRSELLRELYKSLLSGECDHRAARPAAALSPEDLGSTEWYYVVSMTYAFRPGQGLPGRTFISNKHIWLCNAHLADSRTFPRALLAKSTTVQTIICIPLMSGVLELGTTDSVTQDPDLVSRATTSFWELQFPACTEEPCSSPSVNETGEAEDRNAFEDLDHNAMETMVIRDQEELSEVEMLLSASLQHVTNEIDEFSSLCEELDVQPLQDDWIMEGSFEIPCFPEAAGATNDTGIVDRVTSFMTWTGTDSDEASVPVIREPQKLLKKVVAGGAWESSVGGNTARSTQESGIKNHVMSERRRREKLNEMFLILKSLVPTINKVDKASILAETIAYLKELERRVRELESSSREHIMQPSETTRLRGRHNNEIIEKRVSGAKRNKASELSDDAEREHHWVLSKDGTSNVTVTVTDKEVLLEVHCQWEKMLMTRVFHAIKTIHLDVLSVQASTRDGFMGLKIRAQFASSAVTVPRIINEAVRKAIGKK